MSDLDVQGKEDEAPGSKMYKTDDPDPRACELVRTNLPGPGEYHRAVIVLD
jgi:hypothetical protein